MSSSSPESKVIFTVLGSGTSQGVPMIGCRCPVCLSPDPRDQRTRSSIYFETPEAKVLVDTAPDLREQALREGLDHLDAVLFTHAHADHIMGFDDLRRFCEIQAASLPIYGSPETLQGIERIFYYAFSPKKTVPGYVHVVPHQVTGTFTLAGLDITPLPVPHGAITTSGYLFARRGRKLLAYLSDCALVPEPVRARIEGVDTLIIDGLREKEHPTHLNVAGAIAASKVIRARQTYLTHLTHEKSHADRTAQLAPHGNIAVSYDGLKLEWGWD
jgi:phosphoribosyl 1,2-cyclic phosphate phosphodiesterase